MAWLSGWDYRKSHVIQQQVGAGTDYPVMIKIFQDDPLWNIPEGFTFTQRIANKNCSQGITTDGTYLWVTEDTHLWQYLMDGTYVNDRDTTVDGSFGDHLGDLCIYNGQLFIAASNYPTEPEQGAIMVYTAATLAYVGEWVVPAAPEHPSGVAYHNGKFWLIFNLVNNKVVWQLTYTPPLAFAKDTEYNLTFHIHTGTHGYQGLDWQGDFILLPIHSGCTPLSVDVYHWNGAGFDEVTRISQIGAGDACSQGIAVENSTTIWWAERNNPLATHNIVESTCDYRNDEVSCEGNCRNDFGDIRFTAYPDGTTELYRWREEYTAGDHAVFWVRIPDDLSLGNVTIYIYYGNAGATYTDDYTDQEHGENTFPILFDHFDDPALDLTKWIVRAADGSVTIAASIARIQGNAGNFRYWIGSVANMVPPACLRYKALIEKTVIDNQLIITGWEKVGHPNGSNYIRSWRGDEDISTVDDLGNPTIEGNGYWQNYYDDYMIYNIFRPANESLYCMNPVGIFEGMVCWWQDNNPDALAREVVLYCRDSEFDLYVDWVLLRKFVDPEPAHGAWGEQEEEPEPTPPPIPPTPPSEEAEEYGDGLITVSE